MVCVFSNQKYQFGYILEGLGMTNLVYFKAICFSCMAILYFCGHVDLLFHILVCCTKQKSGNPGKTIFVFCFWTKISPQFRGGGNTRNISAELGIHKIDTCCY
jgi:hypothetical protein